MRIYQEASLFSEIALAPPDPILGLTEAYLADPRPGKVNLGVGVYQDELGNVPVLPVVHEAQQRWEACEDTKNYLPIDGVPAYDREVQRLLLGVDSPAISEGRALTVQALGGTGALKIGAYFLRRFFPESGVWISRPSWENHRTLFEDAGFAVAEYPYYSVATHGLDFADMTHTLRGLPSRSIVVLHACCHNPTGVDPSREQWEEIVAICRSGNLIPFLDFAYQGFGEDADADAAAIRAFAAYNVPCLIAQSFSKSFSLYRERVGALTILTADATESRAILSQLKRVIRANYSNPPSHGAQLVALVLSDSDLRAQWLEELTGMRERLRRMRALFVQTLDEKGVAQDFRFLLQQRGMFSYSGLSTEAVHRLRDQYGLYLVESGRLCIGAMNTHNMKSICEAIAQVLRETTSVAHV